MASKYNEGYVQRMRARAARAKTQAEITSLNAKMATETDPVKRAKIKADRAEARYVLAQNKVRKGGKKGGE